MKKEIDLSVGKIINNDGCRKLIEAVYWQAIKDVCEEWNYGLTHPYRCSKNYITAMQFLKSTDKGQRILKLLYKMTDEQRKKISRISFERKDGNDNRIQQKP